MSDKTKLTDDEIAQKKILLEELNIRYEDLEMKQRFLQEQVDKLMPIKQLKLQLVQIQREMMITDKNKGIYLKQLETGEA